MKALLALATALLLVAGCASHGVMVSPEQVAQLKRGESREADVIASLGQPTTVVSRHGTRMFVYAGAQAQARPASFIPFIGPLVGGTDVRASSVVFTFDGEGVLRDVVSTQTQSGGATGFASAPVKPVADTSRNVE